MRPHFIDNFDDRFYLCDGKRWCLMENPELIQETIDALENGTGGSTGCVTDIVNCHDQMDYMSDQTGLSTQEVEEIITVDRLDSGIGRLCDCTEDPESGSFEECVEERVCEDRIDKFIEDQSFINCNYIQCIFEKILSVNEPNTCGLIDPLFDNGEFEIILEIDGFFDETSFDNSTGQATISLNLDCGGLAEMDLEVAATLIHEMIHAEIMMTLHNMGLDPNNMTSFSQAWDNYEVNYLTHLKDVYSLNDIHHAVMVFVDGEDPISGGGAIEWIARILWELNGKQLSVEHYFHMAWDGLRYIDSQWAEDKYGLNSHYYSLHQDLLSNNPNLSIGC